MGELHEHLAVVVNAEPVSLRDVLRHAKLHQETEFIRDAARGVLIRQEAERRGITVSEDELQAAADRFRQAKWLYNAQATHEWLAANRLTVDDLEARLEEEVRGAKLRTAIAEGRLERYFDEHKREFEAATISKIVVRDEGIASEIHLILTEEGVDFAEMAEKYSLDERSRHSGGVVGTVARRNMPEQVAAAVFAAQARSVVAPVPVGLGWDVIRVSALHPAVLDARARETIRSLLFDEWLNAEEERAVRLPVLEEI